MDPAARRPLRRARARPPAPRRHETPHQQQHRSRYPTPHLPRHGSPARADPGTDQTAGQDPATDHGHQHLRSSVRPQQTQPAAIPLLSPLPGRSRPVVARPLAITPVLDLPDPPHLPGQRLPRLRPTTPCPVRLGRTGHRPGPLPLPAPHHRPDRTAAPAGLVQHRPDHSNRTPGTRNRGRDSTTPTRLGSGSVDHPGHRRWSHGDAPDRVPRPRRAPRRRDPRLRHPRPGQRPGRSRTRPHRSRPGADRSRSTLSRPTGNDADLRR